MQFTTELIGESLKLFGKVLLAIAILMVHGKMEKEHRIDTKVIAEIHHEQIITIIAILAMVSGFIFRHI